MPGAVLQSIFNFSSGSSSRAFLPSTMTVLHPVCAKLRIQTCVKVNVGPWYTSSICFFFHPYFFRGTFKAGSIAVLICVTHHKNAHKALCNCGLMQEKRDALGCQNQTSLKGRKSLQKSRKEFS